MSDSVFYEDEPWQHDLYGDMEPGWYFWDECEVNAHGPFENEEYCRKTLKEYAESL